MLVISSREFRQKQSDDLNLADDGEQIVVQRGKNKAYKIQRLRDNDVLIDKSEFIKKINQSLLEAESGKVHVLTPGLKQELFGDL